MDERGRGRRFWSATLVMATTMALVVLDELGVHEFTDAMGLVIAMYVGAVPAEDGMRRALVVWVEDRRVKLLDGHDGRGRVGWLSNVKGKALLYDTLARAVHA